MEEKVKHMEWTIALAGNPNAGKTSLFNVLTGTRQQVGNWAGVTIEKKEGWIKGLPHVRLVDLPGVYSLSAQSLEEKIAVQYMMQEHPDLILNIVDASNLERNLYFTLQLMEMGLPLVVVLNMIDVAEAHGYRIDSKRLANKLGLPVVPVVARKGKGREKVLQAIQEGGASHRSPVLYPPQVEMALRQMETLLQRVPLTSPPSCRWIALAWLEHNEMITRYLQHHCEADILQRMQAIREELQGIEQEIHKARYAWIEKLIREVVIRRKTARRNWSDRIDGIVLHRIWGIPIFFVFMYLIFQFTFSWVGTPLSDRLDTFLSGPVRDGLSAVLQGLNSPAWFYELVINGILAGVGSVLVFVPQIAILFFCLSFLEDSGYMARAAVLMDRFMRTLGLNGKAFIPLILGFGCNVPAIMTTRTLENPKDRLVVALMTPFMSCSARLTVFALFVASFFSRWQAELVFILYLTGILMAVGTAFLLKHRVIRGEGAPFLLEMPPYHTPMWRSLLLHTWDKARGFVHKAGTIIFGMSVLLWFLSHFSWHGMVSIEESFLAAIGKAVSPLFAPLGFATWQAGVSLFSGFLAKEVVISTMSIAYGAANGSDQLGMVLQQVFTPASALSFLFFVLLYTPCLSTVVMMKRETGSWKWTLASVFYSLLAAWLVAFLVYRLALLIL